MARDEGPLWAVSLGVERRENHLLPWTGVGAGEERGGEDEVGLGREEPGLCPRFVPGSHAQNSDTWPLVAGSLGRDAHHMFPLMSTGPDPWVPSAWKALAMGPGPPAALNVACRILGATSATSPRSSALSYTCSCPHAHPRRKAGSLVPAKAYIPTSPLHLPAQDPV